VSRLTRALARTKHRVARSYHLACARDDLLAAGLHIPLGVWFCDHCRLVWWEPDAFRLHLHTHPA
jgi:hypothetical protein